MKIASIKEIKNIGAFANFTNGGPLRFEKLTFIYGFNTSGKTTLTDIFQSFKNNDPTIINSRKTIPIQLENQKVVFSFKEASSERDVVFNNNWGQNDFSKYLEIFGTDFIHKNLFTGLEIERDNKENLTQFILGEQGVSLATEIQTLKKILGERKKKLKLMIPAYVKTASSEEISNFLNYDISRKDKNEIDKNLTQIRNILQEEKKRLKDPTKILQLKEPIKYNLPNCTIIELIKNVNDLFKKDYSNIREDIISKLNEHFINNFKIQDANEEWIKTGLKYCKDEIEAVCPFCGQPLNNARKLLEIYESYFDRSYINFVEELETDFEKFIVEIEKVTFNQQPILNTALLEVDKFRDLIPDINYHHEYERLIELIGFLNEQEVFEKKTQVLKCIKENYLIKMQYPHKKLNPINVDNLDKIISNYRSLLIESKNSLDRLLDMIKSLKRQYEDISSIRNKIATMESEEALLVYTKARIDLNEECKEYITLQAENKVLEKKIEELENRMKREQSDYLTRYFTQINDLFKKLGSTEYSLEQELSTQGHQPVCSLKIKFSNVNIPNDQLKFVFSESDRRALALAIFWAKINLKEVSEKSKTIIVMDDPITSFDKDRITNSINLFKNTIDQVSQMIILTHYPHFIERFCEITRESAVNTKYFKITKTQSSSLLIPLQRDEFTRSEYERVFLRIYGFINREHSESIKAELRPFLENQYLPTVFAKRIKDNAVDCSSLEKIIDGIFVDNDVVKQKMHQYRTDTNPYSHIITSNSEEDVRNFAREMMEYLFSLKYE